MFKALFGILIILLGVLQFRLWKGGGSITDVMRLKSHIAVQESEIANLQLRNQRLEAEVENLKKYPFLLEERARYQLGMVKPGESFFQIVDTSNPHKRNMYENIIK